MAKNPKSRKASDTSQEDTVSDTSTDTEAQAEAPTEAAPAEAAPKPVIDNEGNLFTAITTFASDGNVEALQNAYREVPAAARGKVQGIAMKRAMTEGGVDMDVLGSVLDAFNNLPAATKSSRTKPAVDDATLASIRLAGLMVAYEALRSELGEPAHEQALAWYSEEAPEAHRTAILKVASNAVTASTKGGRGGSGSRSSLTEKLTDLLARGAIEAGVTLKGANDAEAVVNADGTVTTKGEVFQNLSAAARAHRPSKDGKGGTSTNGWDFWQHEGNPVGALRKS